MDHRITQCPRCGTSFRVTEAHLAVAAGAVRCGSCLHIFNARDHWIDAPPPAQAEPEKPLAAAQIDDIEIDDDAMFDDDTPLFDDDEPEPAKAKSASIFNPVDDDFEVIDDSGTEEFSESFLEINSWEEDSGHSFSRDHDADSTDEDEASEISWTQKLLDEDGDKAAAAIQAPARSAVFDDFDNTLEAVPEIDENEAAVAPDGEFSDEFLKLDAGYAEAQPAPTAIDSFTADQADGEPETTDGSTVADRPLFALRDLEQEPIRVHQFVHEPRWPKFLWRIGLVAALALGAWQYIYFNFNELARGPARPWLARACGVFNCVLPPQFDIAQIHTNSLIVRSHPSQKGALAVDAIITNQADFPQPYPLLQLQFSDLNGAPVAGRRFQPSEYLSGELTGARLMPVQQPVHIALEILDPGARAVNYLLTVAPPEPGP